MRRNRRCSVRKRGGGSRRRFWITAAVVVIAIVVGAYVWYSQLRTAAVEYGPCDIEYGEVVAEWNGTGNDPWNQTDYYYQLRRFQIRAWAPDVFFPNTVESPPSRIATGGEHDCRQDFDETVDVTASRYRWRGARTTDIRLGMPAISPAAGGTFLPGVSRLPHGNLATPVYGRPEQAAVWVDDGGAATIHNGRSDHQWWCINYQECRNTARQTSRAQPARGAGYQYTADNCPPEIDCQGRWYTRLDAPRAIEHEHSLLQPFKLRLSAVSTYADTVGTAVLMTFKYPRETSVRTALAGDVGFLAPGSQFEVDLSIHKRGPALDGLTVTADTSDSPVVEAEPIRLDQRRLRQLNSTDSFKLPLAFRLAGTASGGTCHEVPLTIAVPSRTEPLARSGFSYCVAAESRTVRYSVQSRGRIETDMNRFKNRVDATLRDRRGWAAANIVFSRVDDEGDFTLWLAAPEQMTSFSEGCGRAYSCRVGRNVVINDERWQDATAAWRDAGGSLRDYRHMVINHEVGHFLGLGHRSCPEAGNPAPVMMQQSIDLDGCTFNPWPLQGEIERVQ